MNKVFVLDVPSGVVIVIAKDHEEALAMIVDKEKNEPGIHLSDGVVPDQLSMISPEETPEGVHTYHI